ncbi:MAG: YMGG-like glycine zipper-containing protein [Candidatus Brocadiia bacterium]
MSALLVLVLLSPGCAWIQEHQKTAMGAAIGAAGGAIVGGAYKGKKGALWGGLLGALAGGAIGAYLDHRDKTAAQTKQDYNYQPAQGVRLDLVGVGAKPQQVQPGKQVDLQATYALMAPDDQQEVQVTETRVVTLDGAKVAETTAQVARTSGTYTSVVPVTLPPDAAKGTYELQVNLAAAGKTSQMKSAFTVN